MTNIQAIHKAFSDDERTFHLETSLTKSVNYYRV